jgi:hypothetical protein
MKDLEAVEKEHIDVVAHTTNSLTLSQNGQNQDMERRSASIY